jgi:hypothetical protein
MPVLTADGWWKISRSENIDHATADEGTFQQQSSTSYSLTASDSSWDSSKPCEMWRNVLPLLEVTVRTYRAGITYDLTEVATFWNKTVASRYPRTSDGDLAAYVDQNPQVNFIDYLSKTIFDLDEWKIVREAVDNMASTICVDLDGGDYGRYFSAVGLSKMAGTQTNSSVQRRFVHPDIFGPSPDQIQGVRHNLIPNWTTIFAGIAAGKVFPP